MKKIILLLLLLFIVSCGKNEDDQLTQSLSNEDDELVPTLNFEELRSSALNLSDLEFFENCGNDLPPESVNYCSFQPDTVEIGGIYIGGAKFLINDGRQPTFEPSDSTFEWLLTGDGIEISEPNEQFIVIRIGENFTQGTLMAVVEATGGSGSSFTELILKED